MALRVCGGFSRAIYDLQKQFHCAMRVKFRVVGLIGSFNWVDIVPRDRKRSTV